MRRALVMLVASLLLLGCSASTVGPAAFREEDLASRPLIGPGWQLATVSRALTATSSTSIQRYRAPESPDFVGNAQRIVAVIHSARPAVVIADCADWPRALVLDAFSVDGTLKFHVLMSGAETLHPEVVVGTTHFGPGSSSSTTPVGPDDISCLTAIAQP